VLTPLDTARAAYVWRLRLACPDLDQRLGDVHGLVEALLDVSTGADAGVDLLEARARYARCVRAALPSIDDQLAELAELCTWLSRRDLDRRCPYLAASHHTIRKEVSSPHAAC
jgi:hypothetical protein